MHRDVELSFMLKLVDCGRHAKGSVLTLSAPPGFGKSALARQVAGEAMKEGDRVLYIAAQRAEAMVPLAMLHRLAEGMDPGPGGIKIARFLDEIAVAAALRLPAPEPPGTWGGPGMDRLRDEFLDLVRDRPTVIVIDNFQHADEQSVQWLSGLAPLIEKLPVTVVVAGTADASPGMRPPFAELCDANHVHRLNLSAFDANEVTALMATRLCPARVAALAAEFIRLSGGNPMLVEALIEEELVEPRAPDGAPVVGEIFARAVLTLLNRSAPVVLEVAQALAAVGGSARAVRVLALPPQTVSGAMAELDLLGVTDGDGFRHRVAQTAVLGTMTTEQRRRQQLDAAAMLHGQGAPVDEVADQLIGVRGGYLPWALDVLMQAGAQALIGGNPTRAIECLSRAEHGCSDEAQRDRVLMMLACAEWRIDPAAAVSWMPVLLAAQRRTAFPPRQLAVLVEYLLWYGMVSEATEVLERMTGHGESLAAETAEVILELRQWLSFMYPELCVRLCREQILPLEHELLRAAAAGPSGPTAPDGVCDLVVGTQVSEIDVMIRAGRLDEAEELCAKLASSIGPSLRTWQAVATAFSSYIDVLRGRMRQAGVKARAAWSAVSAEGWGVAAGLPLGVLILVAVATGDLAEASRLVETPVPEAMFDTLFGVHFLHARGRYRRSAGADEAALADMLACGNLMSRLDRDAPSWIPWRAEAAVTCVALGRLRRARHLAEEQLDLLCDKSLRARGVAFWALAATHQPQYRPELLKRSANLLEGAEAWLELARTVTDLSRAYEILGDGQEAAILARRGRNLADQCGVVSSLLSAHPPGSRPAATGERAIGQWADEAATPALPGPSPRDEMTIDETADDPARLSDAERRVAALAALGFTNRQIAERLFVTVSTVEQHLTRVYRKLKITRRRDLAMRLQAVIGEDLRSV